MPSLLRSAIDVSIFAYECTSTRKKKAAKTPIIPNLFPYQLGLSLSVNLCISVLRSRARDLISPRRRTSTISSRYARGKDLSLYSDLIWFFNRHYYCYTGKIHRESDNLR